MGRTVRELLATLDAAELQEWIAFHGLDPWDEDRADLRAGIIASVVANCHLAKAKFKPSDFVITYGPPEPPEPKSDEDLKYLAIKANALMGGTVSKAN